MAIEKSSENDEVAREEAGPSVQISEQPDDDFYVPGDDVPIDKILGFEKLEDLPGTGEGWLGFWDFKTPTSCSTLLSDDKASNDQEMSTIESELDVEVEMIESLAVEKWAEVDKKELRRVGSFSDLSKVEIRFSFPERDVDGELQIDEDALEVGPKRAIESKSVVLGRRTGLRRRKVDQIRECKRRSPESWAIRSFLQKDWEEWK